jgi:hypothetical protein
MEIKKQLKDAYKESSEKLALYLKAEEELTNEPEGFFDKLRLDNMVKAKSEWQLANNKFMELLSYVNKSNK